MLAIVSQSLLQNAVPRPSNSFCFFPDSTERQPRSALLGEGGGMVTSYLAKHSTLEYFSFFVMNANGGHQLVRAILIGSGKWEDFQSSKLVFAGSCARHANLGTNSPQMLCSIIEIDLFYTTTYSDITCLGGLNFSNY